MIALLVAVASLCQLASSKVIHYDWNIGWVTAAPDGFARPVIGINGQWPCPQVDAEVGDRIIVDIYNGLGNQSTGLHWHGLHQTGTSYMDGASGVTQCPVAPGESITYDFVANQEGTYWYHSHNLGQYPDGLWGPFIVRGPSFPYADEVEGEIVITLTDWYHEQMPNLLQVYQSRENEASNDGDEPTPDRALINGNVNTTIPVEPNKTYLVRIICVGNWPGHAILFDKHNITVVETDGIWTDKYDVGTKNIRVATGQRMSVLLTTKNDTSQNYAIWDTMDVNMLFIDEGKLPPKTFNGNVTAYLVYNEQAPLPPPPILYELSDKDFVDDVDFVPYDHEPLLEPVDHQFILNTNSATINGVERYVINNITYLPQKVPSLYTALTVGPEYSSNPEVYGQVNPMMVKYGEIIEIVINDYHNNLHPWHLHGHQFQVPARTPPEGGYYSPAGSVNYTQFPIRRDTIMVQNGGHAVIRFRVWLLHCHIEWHVESGLIATVIEAPDLLVGQIVPQQHLDVCKTYAGGVQTYGNAAGNRGNDMSGAVSTVPVGNYGATYPPQQQGNQSSQRRSVRSGPPRSYPLAFSK